jgi:aryl-alcohol dehydrogenase-like predicted oxidoreductase
MTRTTNLGPLGLTVSAQGLGCLNLTGFYGKSFDRDTALATVRQALDSGVTLFDTADSYGAHTDAGFGGSELFVGQAIRTDRANVVLSTKFGFVDVGDDKTGNAAAPNTKPITRADPAYLKSACDASLRRLEVDNIDLYFCHRLDPEVPVEETVGAMAELVAAGKVRYLGLSAVSGASLSRAAAVHPITAVESEWSLWTRDVESTVLPAARDLGVGIMAYAPLGRGFLTGQLTSRADLSPSDQRRGSPRLQGENFDHNLRLVDGMRQLATRKGCSLAQLALAWLHAQGDDVVPIPGADLPKYVSDNVAALEIKLDGDDLAELGRIFPFGAAAGDRYADMSHVSDAVGSDSSASSSESR